MDFRVESSFRNSFKRKRLQKSLGTDGVVALVDLWAFCTDERRDGDLTGMSDEDIELVADWGGEPGELVRCLEAVGFLDGDEGERRVHNWNERQPWVAEQNRRTEAAKVAAKARWEKENMRPQCDRNATAYESQCDPQCPQPNPTQPNPTKEGARKRARFSKADALKAEPPKELDTQRFREAWQRWVGYRYEARRHLTKTTVEQQLADLASWGEPEAVESIAASIRSGWQGLFPPKSPDPPSRSTARQQEFDPVESARRTAEARRKRLAEQRAET